MSTDQRQALTDWAEAGDFQPRRAVTGDHAAADGSALLAAAGIDLNELERRVGGRPRLGGHPGVKGERSPRVNVAVDDQTDLDIERVRAARGMTRSALVRAALRDYLGKAG
ncbi:ribbon-helix-helix domain-containing protein [Cellulomonas sp. NPDC089187]|uniref:ribbon-helix-helix domain-containing protein n=1 Tax=Cellulomonas sp. NPDC089187 TaxID=3154970 RepID=UPI003438625D